MGTSSTLSSYANHGGLASSRCQLAWREVNGPPIESAANPGFQPSLVFCSVVPRSSVNGEAGSWPFLHSELPVFFPELPEILP